MSGADASALLARLASLEARVAELEGALNGGAGARRRGTASGTSSPTASGGSDLPTGAGWTRQYEVAQLEVAETWIELHEPSARPQLQRLIREVVSVEGPVTDRLVLDRIRRAWGLRRAGGRVQEAFDAALRQLLARGLVERDGDGLVAAGRATADEAATTLVRVPGSDELSRRGADDVPLVELAQALAGACRELGALPEGDLTMGVAKLLGWTRRGGAIQVRLDAALAEAVTRGYVRRADNGRIAPA